MGYTEIMDYRAYAPECRKGLVMRSRGGPALSDREDPGEIERYGYCHCRTEARKGNGKLKAGPEGPAGGRIDLRD